MNHPGATLNTAPLARDSLNSPFGPMHMHCYCPHGLPTLPRGWSLPNLSGGSHSAGLLASPGACPWTGYFINLTLSPSNYVVVYLLAFSLQRLSTSTGVQTEQFRPANGTVWRTSTPTSTTYSPALKRTRNSTTFPSPRVSIPPQKGWVARPPLSRVEPFVQWPAD